MEFRFFDPSAKTEVTHGHLPHWEQMNAFYFITWRTADSIPADALEKWQAGREAWLWSHGIDSALEDWQRELECLPEAEHQEFYRLVTTKWHSMLDECHGDCVLRRPELSEIVAENMLHQDGIKYSMEAFVVMPNHVHVLAGVAGRGEMKRLCRNWKRYTAGRINAVLNREGQFWQWEIFDHVVRSEASLRRFREYVVNNPVKARLKADEYRVWTK
ncbi:MAG: transposase [Prosthecobacter sp.]|jgi:putative transposase|uniref:transposase n=1 Tax=Prosthecobacter sp. TaxID=1965333 RepID=UPI001A06C67E|nr:transposase [Prosthecobacter sp.]MBE2286145.1 transposase [Prosthecobacter sp.]